MGKIILIEGTDCSGKATQSKLLTEKLKKLGYSATYFTFPNYDSPTGKIVGGPYLGKEEICESYFKEGASHVPAYVASLYFAADRYYNMPLLLKLKEENDYVILDRYVYSNMAHQGGKIKDKVERYNMYEFLYHLEFNMLGLVKPDKVIFLHMPYLYAKELKQNRKSLDGHEKDEEHLQMAESSYLELRDKFNFSYVICVKEHEIRDIEDINNEVLDIILK